LFKNVTSDFDCHTKRVGIKDPKSVPKVCMYVRKGKSSELCDKVCKKIKIILEILTQRKNLSTSSPVKKVGIFAVIKAKLIKMQ